MPSKDNLYNGRKGIGFENPRYFEKAKDLRPTLYDEKVIGLEYTSMFHTHSDEALEIKKFKRSRENKIEFAYDYGNLNASYVNEKINFEDDYFQEIINPDFEKIDSSFQQTSSLKPYVPNVILKKIIIDLEDKVVNLLEKEKVNLETIKSLKSKSFKSSEKKVVVVTSDPLAVVAEKTKVSKRKEKVIVQSESEGSDDEDISDLKNITALLAKSFNRKKYYAKTNNNWRTSSASSSANKKPEYVKSEKKAEDKKVDEKKRDMSKVKCYNCKNKGHYAKDCKKAKVKDYNYYKTKMLLAKKDSAEQVLIAEDQAWMESSSDSNQEINTNMVFMAKIEKVLSASEKSSSSAEQISAEVSYYTSDSESESEYETSEYYDNSTNHGLFVDNDDDQKKFHDAIEFASENFNENHIVSQTDHDQSEVDHNDSEEKDHLVDKLIKKKKIDEHEILFDKMSRQFNEMNNNVMRLQEKILEKDTKISELKECVRNKDLEIKKCLKRLNDCENKLHKIEQTHQTIHMIMPSKDKLYNGRKGIGFENPSYFCKAKDLRHSLYDERVIGKGYTPMFLTHSNDALDIENFKRARENKIEFAYDYENLNASYVNEKINFSDDYFQERINPDFEKIDYPFQQTSSLKLYVSTVILENIIIDFEDEVVSLLEKGKENLEIIESLKSKSFESRENAISESENQSENDCQEVKKGCDNLENPKVIAPGMFKINVSRSVSPILVLKTSCASNNVENKTKRKRRKRTSSKQNDKQVDNDVLRANRDFVHFSNLDTLSSVRRPKHSGVIWKKKWSSNTSNVDLSSISHSKLNKDVNRYSRKDLLSFKNNLCK
nr:hypothetical protein [Tanacetum cinerariifolium]